MPHKQGIELKTLYNPTLLFPAKTTATDFFPAAPAKKFRLETV